MNVILGTSRGYLPYSAVTAASVCRHAREGDRVAFHLLHADRIGAEERGRFERNLERFSGKATFEFVPVSDSLGLAKTFRTTAHIRGAATYLRLYIPELFRGRFSRALYLDSDLVVCRDPRELFEADMRGHCLAGVEDMLSLSHLRSLGLPEDGAYVNAGVLLYDLDRIDVTRMRERLEEAARERRRYIVLAGDQDLLSLLFHDSTLYLPPLWNAMSKNSYIGRSFSRSRCGVQNRHSPEVFVDSLNNPGIVHYIGGVKPWHRTWYYDPLAPRWFDYARLTGYYGEEWWRRERFVRIAAFLNRMGVIACRPFSFLAGRALRRFLSSFDATAADALRAMAASRRLAGKKNALLAANAVDRSASAFDVGRVPESEFATVSLPVGRPFDSERDIDETGRLDFYRNLFSSPFLVPAPTPEKVAGTGVMMLRRFSDDRFLKTQIAMLERSLRGEAPLYFVEDGPVAGILDRCSCRAVPAGFRRAYSFVVDDLAFSCDSVVKSRLRRFLESADSAIDAATRRRCRKIIDAVVSNRLTRYNFALEEFRPEPDGRRAVLVVDQERGDPAVRRGGATRRRFGDMLRTALAENPDSRILVLRPQTMHPVKGHLDGADGPRLARVDGRTNPYGLFGMVDRVYVVNSPIGLEALLAGARVTCFGMSVYSGLGLTEDRHSGASSRAIDVETLVNAIFLRQTRYFSPETFERVDCEVYLGAIGRLRDEYGRWLAGAPRPSCPPVRGLPEAIDCPTCQMSHFKKSASPGGKRERE